MAASGATAPPLGPADTVEPEVPLGSAARGQAANLFLRIASALVMAPLALAAVWPSAYADESYTLDPVHSQPRYEITHMRGLSMQWGSFGKLAGKVTLDRAARKGSVEVTVDTTSIHSHDPRVDAILKGPAYFNVEKYPTMSFRSTRVEKASDGALRLHGSLTMHGVTKPVVLDVEYAGTQKDPWGGYRAGFSAKASLGRKDFGLVWNQLLETGGVAVGDKVEIDIEIEAVKQVPAAAGAAA